MIGVLGWKGDAGSFNLSLESLLGVILGVILEVSDGMGVGPFNNSSKEMLSLLLGLLAFCGGGVVEVGVEGGFEGVLVGVEESNLEGGLGVPRLEGGILCGAVIGQSIS